ncbi:MAG TPA: sialidase family protein, partial [Gammaproteobacteria bacterium]|nr:sialidase family protein [Gammaproteobacteria bacterium]
SGNYLAALKAIRSTDHGTTWSAPVAIASVLAVGTRDPQTGKTIRTGAGMGDIAVGPAGNLYVVWQDSRFSGGRRDGIALSQSTDGGLSWSAPVEINAVPSTQAFTPSITVLSNGTLAVTYYDFRNDTANPSTLVTDLWETLSADGVTWHERHVSGPFNLDLAPDAEGLFLGDYQGLATDGTDPFPFFVRTVSDATGPTDVFAFPPALSAPVMMAISQGYAGRPARSYRLTDPVRRRIGENLRRLVRHEAHRPRPPFRQSSPD